MTNDETVFTVAERDRRRALARELMDAEGADALLAYGEAGTYLTGGLQATVLLPRHRAPVVLADAPAPDVRPLHAYGLVEAFRERGLVHGRIGVLGLEPYPAAHALIPYSLWDEVRSRLPRATFVSVWPAYVRRTMPQSAEEIAVLDRAAAVGELMVGILRRRGVRRLLRADAMRLGLARGVEPDIIGDEVVCRLRGKETCHRITAAPTDVRVLRPGALFGEVADALRTPDGTVPAVLGLNPRGLVGEVESEGRPTIGYDVVIVPGMTFAVGGRTVVVESGGPRVLGQRSSRASSVLVETPSLGNAR